MRVLTRKEFQDDVARMWSEAVEAEYKDLIEKAVLAEREACADMVFRYIAQTDNMEARGCLASVAHDIRARGES
jgi:hypothetical protein